jgi:POT family proton-dependent oligopeptide transporter
MIWLVLAYLFHTIGELCFSPVSLSYITKLAPKRYGSTMMGLYFAVTGFGGKFAGILGEKATNYGEFTVFTFIFLFCVISGTVMLQF